MERLSRDNILNMLKNPALTKQEIISIFKEEMDIVLDSGLDDEELTDQIFSAYNSAIIETEENRIVQRKERARRKTKSGGPSRKDFIVDLIKEGKHTKSQIMEIVSEEFGYAAQGRSPKTRVSRVIRELKAANNLEESVDGIIKTRI